MAKLAFKLIPFVRIMRDAAFDVSLYNLNDYIIDLLGHEDLQLPDNMSMFDLLERHMMPPTVFGSGRTDLVQKLTNTVHKMRVDVASGGETYEQYRHSVLSWTTDKGTEAGLGPAPAVDNDKFQREVCRDLQSGHYISTQVCPHPTHHFW